MVSEVYFSVILPTYNRARFLPKAVESVIAQTFSNWELIIVDDGSTDNTREVIESYSDPRLHFVYQENQERSAARNNGISHAQGQYICFLDSDDYFLPEKLSNLKEVTDGANEKPAIWFDGLLLETEEKRQKLPLPQRENLSMPDFIVSNTLFSQQICGSKEIFVKHQYNPDLRIGEDVELWLRISEGFPFFPVKDSYQTVIVEHDDRSINLKKANAAMEQLETLRYIFSINPGKKVSRRLRKRVLSNCMFNVAKHFMYRKEKLNSIKWVFISLFQFSGYQLKHKLYCLIKLCLWKIPNEYRI